MADNKELAIALGNAAAYIVAIHEWVDRVKAEGGTTSIAGVAKCHAMFQSIDKNRQRTETLILAPAQKALGNLR